jgi:hypothetical protein
LQLARQVDSHQVDDTRVNAVAGNRGDAGGFGFRGKLQRLFDRLSL